MYQVIIVIQVLVGLGIIGLVLMQHGKGADAGAAFGSGSSGSVFGAQGSASFLSRATGILAVVFFASSLGLAILSGYVEENSDLMDVPELEESFEDVPLLGDSNQSAPVPVAIQDQLADELPTTEGMEQLTEQIEATTNVVIEQVVEEAPAQITDAVNQQVPEVVEQAISTQEVPVAVEEQVTEEVVPVVEQATPEMPQ